MPFLWNPGEIGDAHWAFILFFLLILLSFSFMFYVINWLFHAALSVEEYGVFLDGVIKWIGHGWAYRGFKEAG